MTPRSFPLLGLVLLISSCAPSTAELQRYASLDETLQPLNQAAWRASSSVVLGLEADTERHRFQPRDVALARQAREQHVRTAQLLAALDSVRHLLRQATGNSQQLVELDAHRTVTRVMLGPGGAGPALQQQLDAYAHALRVPVRGQRVFFRSATQVQVRYQDAPLVAVLTLLSQAKAEVLRAHTQALDSLAAQVEGATSNGERYFPAAVAQTDTVPAGGIYRATFFLTHSLHVPLLEQMRINGQPVRVDRYGRGQVSVAVPPWRAGQPERVAAAWTGTIKAWVLGRMDSFTLRVPYVIVKPRKHPQ